MSHKKANPHVGCKVASCMHHCAESECCSLDKICVDVCPGCGSGCAKDESMCASYCAK